MYKVIYNEFPIFGFTYIPIVITKIKKAIVIITWCKNPCFGVFHHNAHAANEWLA